MNFDYPLKIEGLLPGNIVWYIPENQRAWIESTKPLTIFTHKPQSFICLIGDILGYRLDSRILEQCGYKEYEINHFYRDFGNLQSTLNATEYPLTLSVDGVEYSLKYLHQLQNLQFELTGVKSAPNLL